MQCERIEELLPSYVEGDLEEDERISVEAHLAACPGCREAFGLYTVLEESLVSLKEELPSARAASRMVARRLRFNGMEAWLSSMRSAPVLGSISLLAVAVLAILLRPNLDISAPAARIDRIFAALADISQALPAWIVRVTDGDLAMIITIYAAAAAIISTAGYFTVFRFIRE
jgi:anti-sigma factor RsiW